VNRRNLFKQTRHFLYAGPNPKLVGKGARGRWVRGQFKIQLNDRRYNWAFGWHATSRKDWQLDTWATCVARIRGMLAEALLEHNPWMTMLTGGVFPEGMNKTIRHES
jgi:hypothetical protein